MHHFIYSAAFAILQQMPAIGAGASLPIKGNIRPDD